MAFLRDTVAAAAAVPGVADIIVVSSDPVLLTTIPDIILLADPGQGLNIAATAGIDRARSLNPRRPVAVLTGDLPCLDSRDLAAALSLAAKHPLSVVPDIHGSGSTMICALPGTAVRPQFGLDSFLAHVRAGHTVLPIPAVSTLRRDVDSVEDLHQSLRRGVGKYTRSAVLQPWAWPRLERLDDPGGPQSPLGAAGRRARH
ncbi:2-phospho-L-lactate guanylyltransferase [Arthrobacter ginsengisoli]|uniref:2-phospho-L-lactate guanylyltransferase n=1 Tax=Arthrobacter ginsengisoli TaxID=1356565 RepID=A0ABU1UIR1_9MICC|nr:2-phospho-L-lactate guanylyltransferase [Arthrobacter ginsengisoli]